MTTAANGQQELKRHDSGQQSGKRAVSFEEYLSSHDSLTYTNVGTSMMPLLRQGKDLLTVTRALPGRRKPGDVVLYRRGGRYVLHRIIAVRPEDYVILGDNCIAKEYGITDDDIIGVMTAYVRGAGRDAAGSRRSSGRTHSIDEPVYRAYTWIIMHTIPIRIALKKTRMRIGKLARKHHF